MGVDAKLPEKQLYDKAMERPSSGHYDVARLDLQTLLNTYPDSQYQMRAKLAIADSWYQEGGTAALTQAEAEYADFRVFFPNAPEAAEAQMRIGDIYFRQMDKPDRDYSKATHAEEEYRRMLTDYPDSMLVPEAQAAAARGAGGAGDARERDWRRTMRPHRTGRRRLRGTRRWSTAIRSTATWTTCWWGWATRMRRRRATYGR